jgi:hypothetical protein
MSWFSAGRPASVCASSKTNIQPGPKDNPATRSGDRERCFTDMLRIAVAETDKPTGKLNLRIIADQLNDAPKAGQPWAIAMVADRLEGKPHQSSTVSVGQKRVTEMTREELLSIAAQGMVKDDEPAEEQETEH